MTIETIRSRLDQTTPRSAWDRGVRLYASDLLEDLETLHRDGYISSDELADRATVKEALLNGARSWKEFSWGGSSLICDSDIAFRLCTPSELKKTKNGQRRPNSREEWPDTQARALYQASRLILDTIR